MIFLPGARLHAQAGDMRLYHTANLRSFGFDLFGATKFPDANLKRLPARRRWEIRSTF